MPTLPFDAEPPADFRAWLATVDDSPLDLQTIRMGAALCDALAPDEAVKLRACLRKGAWSTKYHARQLLMDDALPETVRAHACVLAYRAFTVRGWA